MRVAIDSPTQVWKFPIEVANRQAVQMPVGAKILTAQTQGSGFVPETLCLWAMVNPRSADDVEDRFIEIVGTGHPFQVDDLERVYIGSVQMAGGSLVFHVFEFVETEA